MEINNTKHYQNIITGNNIVDETVKNMNIGEVIGAFSEYIVAVNPEYRYNKTYLNSYVEDFIECRKALKKKYEILIYILNQLETYGINKDYIIKLDEAWIFEKGKIRLSNTIDPNVIKSDKIRMELELVHDNGYVIAVEKDMEKDLNNEYLEEKIKPEIERFMERRKELIGDEV